jgi:hypothetical protein
MAQHNTSWGILMTRDLVENTMAYVRKELTEIAQMLSWSDGSELRRLTTRQSRLIAELDRLTMIRHAMRPDTHEPGVIAN